MMLPTVDNPAYNAVELEMTEMDGLLSHEQKQEQKQEQELIPSKKTSLNVTSAAARKNKNVTEFKKSTGTVTQFEIGHSDDLGDFDDLDEDFDEDFDEDVDDAHAAHGGWWQDLVVACYEARFMAPLCALLGFLVAYQLVVLPYPYPNATMNKNYAPMTMEELGNIRPMLTVSEKNAIQRNVMFAETQLWLPAPYYDTIKFRFFQHANKHGNFRLPSLFYEGVAFGVSNGNPHNLSYSGRRELAFTDLEADLRNMFPKPTYVIPRMSFHNVSEWNDEGFAAYFSYADLKQQGKYSGIPGQPWKRVLSDVLEIARNYRQTYVTMWYPHTFGMDTGTDPTSSAGTRSSGSISTTGIGARSDKTDTDPHKYTNIIQEVVPTRTGLNEVRSSVVVWLDAVNHTAKTKPEHVYRREWTSEQEWEPWLYRNLHAEATGGGAKGSNRNSNVEL